MSPRIISYSVDKFWRCPGGARLKHARVRFGAVDELGCPFVDAAPPHLVEDAHAPRDFDALLAKVDLLPAGTQGREALDDGARVTQAREPECDGRPGDAAASYEDSERRHGFVMKPGGL